MVSRSLGVAAAVASAAVSVGCAGTTQGTAVTPPTRSMIARPLVEREITGLLLSVDQVNAAMGINTMAVTNTATTMADNAGIMAPPECLAIDGAAEARVYATSGYMGERDESLSDGDKLDHYVKQAVVLFPTAEQAQGFLTTSAQQWPACHEYVHTQSQSHWVVAPINSNRDVLSTTTTELGAQAPGRACGRALQRQNNIIIDVNTCAANPADSAVKIAGQIAVNVAARW